MIIIKTKTGNIFVNDKEMINVTHNRELHTAKISSGKRTDALWHKPPIEHVESVSYINEQTGNEWTDNGSQVANLQRQLADLQNEMKWECGMTKRLEDYLRSFASEMIQIVTYERDKIPADICKQVRDHGEEMKAIANHDDGNIYFERRQWLEAHRVAEASEADATDKLHKTIEEQAAEIRNLKDEIRRMEANERMRQVLQPAHHEGKKTSWWQRLWFTLTRSKSA